MRGVTCKFSREKDPKFKVGTVLQTVFLCRGKTQQNFLITLDIFAENPI